MEKIDKSRFAWVGSDPEKREGMARPSVTYWKDAIGRLKKNRVAMVCLCIIILLILSCVIIPWVTPFDSREQHLSCSNKGFFFSCVDERYEGQNLVHVFGTGPLGRDLLSRAFERGRVSLLIAFAAVGVNLIIGMIYALDKLAPGTANYDTLLYGAEVKFYSARIRLSNELETALPGFFAVGDGAGVTRGLAQAGASGVKAARVVAARLNQA